MDNKTRIISRKRGKLVRLVIEIDASQSRQLDTVIKQLGMTKVDAVSSAINIWLNMVTPKEGGQNGQKLES